MLRRLETISYHIHFYSLYFRTTPKSRSKTTSPPTPTSPQTTESSTKQPMTATLTPLPSRSGDRKSEIGRIVMPNFELKKKTILISNYLSLACANYTLIAIAPLSFNILGGIATGLGEFPHMVS